MHPNKVTEGFVNEIVERLIKTAIDNDAAKRNKERAMLAQVLIRREPKRGGITAKRACR